MSTKKTETSLKPEKVLEDLTRALLEALLVKAEVEVSEDKENSALRVQIKATEEAGLLIGKRGENLFSLQYILSLALKQKTGEWQRVLIDVGDYREKQEDYLRTLAKQTAARVKETEEPQSLYNLTPAQRRTIHITLSQEEGIITESLGEDKDRYLVVKKK